MITTKDVRELMEKMALDFGENEFDSSANAFRSRSGGNLDVRSTPKPAPAAPRKVNYEGNVKPKATPLPPQSRPSVPSARRLIHEGGKKWKTVPEYEPVFEEDAPSKKHVDADLKSETGSGVLQNGTGEFITDNGTRVVAKNWELTDDSRERLRDKKKSFLSNPIGRISQELSSPLKSVSNAVKPIASGIISDMSNYEGEGRKAGIFGMGTRNLLTTANKYREEEKARTLPYYGKTIREAHIESEKKSELARGKKWTPEKEEFAKRDPISVSAQEIYARRGAYNPTMEGAGDDNIYGGKNRPQGLVEQKRKDLAMAGANFDSSRIIANDEGVPESKAYDLYSPSGMNPGSAVSLGRNFELVEDKDKKLQYSPGLRPEDYGWNDMRSRILFKQMFPGKSGVTKPEFEEFKARMNDMIKPKEYRPGLITAGLNNFKSTAIPAMDKIFPGFSGGAKLVRRNLGESIGGIGNAVDWISEQDWR